MHYKPPDSRWIQEYDLNTGLERSVDHRSLRREGNRQIKHNDEWKFAAALFDSKAASAVIMSRCRAGTRSIPRARISCNGGATARARMSPPDPTPSSPPRRSLSCPPISVS